MTTSSAALFLSIHASNALIGTLFFPLISAAFLSPFVLVALTYGPLHLDVSYYITALKTVALQVIVASLASIIATRALSSYLFSTTKNNSGKIRTVPTRPYWIPALQHIVPAVFGGSAWWKMIRDKCSQPILALSFGGAKHNFVVSPHLAQEVEKAGPSALDSTLVRRTLLTNAFGLTSHYEDIDHLQFEFNVQLRTSDFFEHFIKKLEQDLPNLVSFMPTVIDQMPWERTAGVDVEEEDGSNGTAKTSLSSIVREFLGYAITSALLGSSFVNNYSNLAKDLETLNSSIFSLGAGLPRWFPTPGIVTAYAVRRRLLTHLTAFHNALDLSLMGESVIQTYGDLSDVSSLFLDLAKNAKQRGMCPEDRAKTTLALLWRLNSCIIPQSFWLLFHLLNDANCAFDAESSMMLQLRTEIKPHVRAVQPAMTLGISEPPYLELSSSTLLADSRVAQACLLETLRVNYSSWRMSILKEDIDVSEVTVASSEQSAETVVWRLRKGEWVHLAGALYYSSPQYFLNPGAWQPGQHHVQEPKTEDDEPQSTVQGVKISPVRWSAMGGPSWGHGSDGKALAEISVAFVAGVIALWDAELMDKSAADVKPSMSPGAWSAPGVDFRVRLRRRVLPTAP
ncbi:hypothetical protein EJ05DRAFT_502657 [Pseudovirgaria hyperparasitica]|uniref:Cytochrome P450 n=1 Tax=Pseudovirgaria hyperparasitica TaxID=470096 RepID=A0A6A6W0X3_9PEZI|nr:uncharacterized protein EJ05DRAFT_502657 [Pseudovirgaria hyperparasitica]KAF2756193.1 hypothetical protein EJ05DRAFT_502657 [Pseudovirgaria hyperparasitica]